MPSSSHKSHSSHSSNSSHSHRPSKKHYSSSISSGSYSASDSDLSSSSGRSSYRHSMDSQRPAVSVQVLRCMRCARTVEVTSTDDASVSGMVRVGHNIYYCHRCAKLVGYS